MALERWRAGLLPLSFSHCFCDRRGARGRIINSSPHSAGHSRVRYRPRGDNDDQSDDDPIEETWRTTTEPLPLPFPSPIVNYPAWVPLLRATANKRIFPSVSFFFFFFFFFCLPPGGSSRSTPSSFHPAMSPFFPSLSLSLSLVRSERLAAERRDQAHLVLYRSAAAQRTIIVFYCVPLHPLTIYSCAEISARVDSSECEWNSRDTEARPGLRPGGCCNWPRWIF